MAKLSDIFISGGQPTVTYNPRTRLHLEDKLDEYLDMGHKILAITGPTKSGKTVLVRSKIDMKKSCWISGGQISNENEFWEAIIEKYEGYTDYSKTESDYTEFSDESGVDSGFDVKLLKMNGKTSSTETFSTEQSISRSRKLSTKAISTRLLNDNINDPIIIDDFHYIDQEVQKKNYKILKRSNL